MTYKVVRRALCGVALTHTPQKAVIFWSLFFAGITLSLLREEPFFRKICPDNNGIISAKINSRRMTAFCGVWMNIFIISADNKVEKSLRRSKMKEFIYTITDEIGIHARPAGQLVKTASRFSSDILLECGEKSANAKKILAVMGLGAKQGSDVKVIVNGSDEDTAASELKNFFGSNL